MAQTHFNLECNPRFKAKKNVITQFKFEQFLPGASATSVRGIRHVYLSGDEVRSICHVLLPGA